MAGGYALTSIAVKYGPDEVTLDLSRLHAQLWSAATGGGPGTKVADLAIPSTVRPGVVSFTAPGTELDPSTTYYFVVYTTTPDGVHIYNFPVHVTQSTSEDSGGFTGWSIENFSYDQQTVNAPSGSSWNKRTGGVFQIRVNAAAAPSEPRNVTIVSGDDEVTVTWDVPTSWGTWNAAGYSFDVFGQGGSWEAAGLLTNPTATTHTLVRGIYGDSLEVCNGCDVQVTMYAYSQRPGTDGSKGSHYVVSAAVYTDTVRVGGPMAAPTGLTVTASARALGLSWTAPAAGTAEAVTGYDVHYTSAAKSSLDDDERGTGRNAAAAWVDANHTGTTASATIGGLAASTAYRVRVRARNTHGGGPWVFGTGTTPAAWSSLTITERNRSLIVSWTAPTGTWTGYDVHVTSAAPWDLADDAAAKGSDADVTKAWRSLARGTEASPPTPSQTIIQMVNDLTYRVRVRAKTSTSTSIWVFGTGTPKKPAVRFAGNGATVTEGGSATITLNISYPIGSNSVIAVTASGSGRYTGVPTNVALPATATSAQVSVTPTDDTDNEDHETVHLRQAATTSPPYSWNITPWPVTILDNDPPLAPTVLAVSGGLQSLTATWEKPAGPVQLYEVQLKEASAPDTNSTDATPATGWDLVATVSKSPSEAAPTSVTIGGDLGDNTEYFLRHRTAYDVRVRANDGQQGTGNGYSDWSAPRTVTTAHVSSPSAPRFFRAEPNDPGELRVSWWRPKRGRDGHGLGTSSQPTHFDLQYTTAAETEVPDNAAASGTDPSVAWINANLRASIISGLQGVRHRLRVRYHNRFGAGAWAYTTGTPQASFQTTAPTLTVPKAWVLPLNLRWEHPVPGLTPAGYHVHYTSAPKTGDGAVGDTALPVSGTDPAAGWIDATSSANRVATTANGHNSWYAPTLKRGTEYRFRVRAAYPHYVFHRRRPDRHSDWAYKALVAGEGTAVGLFAFNAFESRGLSSVRINLANPVSHQVTVDYRTSVPPTRAATPGLDYLAVWGSFTFEPGDTQRWLHLAITDDDIEDSGEQFVITLSNPQPANRVQLGSSSPGYGYHVHPLATSMTVTIYNHEAELEALAVETAPAEDGPWTALDFGAFRGGTTDYAVTVPHGTTHARLKPTALHEKQRLKAGTGSSLHALESGARTGALALEVGDNALVVESVVSGERKTYTVTVTRQAEAPAAVAVNLSALTGSTSTDGATFEGTLNLGTFAADTTTYTATVAHAVTHVKLTPTASAAGTTVQVGTGSSLAAVASGATSAAIALDVGTNALEVTVSANDGRTKTYTVTVTREAPPPLTATFENVPAEHTGEPFTLGLVLSDTPAAGTAPVAASFKVVPGKASVTGSGTRYTVTVTPKPANAWKDVTVTLLQPTDCTVAGAVCTADGRALSNRLSRTITGPVRIRIEGARAKEGQDASLDFAVTLNRAAAQAVSVDYATADETATAGADYTATSGTLTFAAGETAKTVSVPVLDDAVDEGKEVMRLLLSNPQGAFLRKKHERARGIIVNDDPLQRAWLSRFGRTVATHVTDAVGDRLRGAPGQESHVTIGGYRLPLDRAAASQPAPDEATPGTELRGTGAGPAQPAPGAASNETATATAVLTEVARMLGIGPGAAPAPATPGADHSDPRLNPGRTLELGQTFTLRRVLLGSAFRLNLGATDADAATPRLTAWGRVAGTTFEGRDGALALNGDVLTGTVGLDGTWDRLMLGLAVAHSRGDGGFTQPNLAERGTGDLEQTLTSLHPYLRYAVTDRLDVWGLVGYGWGELDLEMANGVTVETDTTLVMGAFGGRGILLAPAETGGFQLATRTDAMLTRTSSDAVANSAATDADAHRLRVILEGSRGVTWADGRSLTPTVELGVRHDWGDAETGFGLEVGGRVSYADPTLGLTVEGTVRGLLAHEADAYKEWGASGSVRLDPGAAGRGLSVTLAPTWGAAASGVDGLWSRQTTQGLAPATQSAQRGRLAADVGYGFAAFDSGLLTPYAGTVLAAGADRTYRVGTRVQLPGLTVNLEGTRQEPTRQPVNQGVRLQVEWGF